ncbi:MAG: ABC transporter substrate-binding protein [Aromatoleum sp.]|jgi:phospholipid transport system substrate-binding protein|uniref:MlaC/ttg2D family ABC transporter substrate-binding protein n=1 Tax=Aromatoleum sp. TaxID=2307007 RepID=UPI002895DF76|nr:ABC transporter substrate-binding protein [Aromatoleum sp.]MDT3670924.1 ABC transporter substrate-binding protein [Aromatoleum sp.]
MKSAFFTLCFSVLTLLPFGVSANGPAPDQLITKLCDEVVDILRSNKPARGGDTAGTVRLVQEAVLPHFNFRRMTMLAVGRDWRAATPEQQKRLTDAFYGMLTRTYSNALTQYRDQTVSVRPLRLDPAEKSARVQTEIHQPGGQPVSVDYVLELRPDGWKIFDIVVAGVSLVTNYRGTFAREISLGGIDGLIKSLETKERQFAQTTQS